MIFVFFFEKNLFSINTTDGIYTPPFMGGYLTQSKDIIYLYRFLRGMRRYKEKISIIFFVFSDFQSLEFPDLL